MNKEKGVEANDSDYSEVGVCFNDQQITDLFSELLKAHGIKTRIIEDLIELPFCSKVITEPRYFPLVSEISRSRSLVVGEKDDLNELESLTLSRPLTESKIQLAITEFLRA